MIGVSESAVARVEGNSRPVELLIGGLCFRRSRIWLAAAWALVVSRKVSSTPEKGTGEVELTQGEAKEESGCLAAEDDCDEDDEKFCRIVFPLSK